MKTRRAMIVTATLMALGASAPCWGQAVIARVGDVTRLKGEGTNVLVGHGLVTGLNGTGDGDNYRATIERLAQGLRKLGAYVEEEDLKGSKSVALVMLEAVVPEHGAREGERIDVIVTAVGAAKSLAGGRLLSTPLVYGDPNVDGLFATARGGIVVDADSPTSGTIRGGARMETDVFMNVVASGGELLRDGITAPWIDRDESYITLVIDGVHAGWPMAAAIAQAVDKELGMSADVERVALAIDSKSVVVLLPKYQRNDPASWIRDVQRTPLLMESNEARVTINRRTGTIVVTGDTRISPVVVSQKGMTITVLNSGPDVTVPKPMLERHDFIPVDIESRRGANVKDLLEALNRLKVPFEDRLAILEEVRRAGKLHAEILYEG